MRLGWYRHFGGRNPHFRQLRVRKARHTAFLHDLLRRRELNPAWYARLFYWMGHIFGWCTALLPLSWGRRIENTLEFWILLRYKKYLRTLQLRGNLRTMIEALQLNKLNHSEPGEDVLLLLNEFVEEEEGALHKPPSQPAV